MPMNPYLYTYMLNKKENMLNDWPWIQGINYLIFLRVIYYFFVRAEVLGSWRYMASMSSKRFFCCCFLSDIFCRAGILINGRVLPFSLTLCTLTPSMIKAWILQQTNCPVLTFHPFASQGPKPGASLGSLDHSSPALLAQWPHVTGHIDSTYHHSPLPTHPACLSQSSGCQREWSYRNHLSGHLGWHVQKLQLIHIFILLKCGLSITF